MRRKLYSGIVKKLASSIAILGITASSCAFANQALDSQAAMNKEKKEEVTREYKKHKHHKKHKCHCPGNQGWVLSSTGGLSYVHPNNDSHWFKLSGVIRLDETLFMGSYRDKQPIYGTGSNAVNAVSFPSSANLRRVEAYMVGGIGKNWEYTLGLTFFTGSNVRFTDTWLSYTGFLENNQVFVGRVSGNWFGLDNSNSTTWNPFLERSLAASAFYPGDGLGVMTDFWWHNGAVTLAAMQPEQKPNSNGVQSVFNNNGSEVIPGVRDRWRGTVRATVAPVHEVGNVWHFGISGAYRELNSAVNGVAPTQQGTGVDFMVGPGATGRNVISLLNTTTVNGGAPICANNVRMFNVEMAKQHGPFMLEGEYTNVFVHRVNSTIGTVRFDGWNVQTRYLLTGEAHKYDVRDGNFSTVEPNNHYGAVELAARYDYVTLNDKDVRGGSEHNVTVGLNWFINQQVRLSANYIRAAIHPVLDAPKRNLDIVGMRCQVRFK